MKASFVSYACPLSLILLPAEEITETAALAVTLTVLSAALLRRVFVIFCVILRQGAHDGTTHSTQKAVVRLVTCETAGSRTSHGS